MQKIEYSIIYCSNSWHAGTRLNYEDALKKGCKAMKEIYHSENGQGNIEIIKVVSGTTVNMHPSKCEFIVRIWYENLEAMQNATSNLKAILNNLLSQNQNMKYEMKLLH